MDHNIQYDWQKPGIKILGHLGQILLLISKSTATAAAKDVFLKIESLVLRGYLPSLDALGHVCL